MSAPIERARDQINAMLDGGRSFTASEARSVLNAAIDTGELARVIDAGIDEYLREDIPEDGLSQAEVIARAVRDYLLTGDESDE